MKSMIDAAPRRKCSAGILAAVLAMMTLASCSVTVASKAIGPCSPNYTINNPKYGRASAQQAGRGQAVAWGVYLVDKYKTGTHFVVAVFADGVKVDNMNQNYEPHAHVPAATALKHSGRILEIIGSGTHGRDTLNFDLKCKIA